MMLKLANVSHCVLLFFLVLVTSTFLDVGLLSCYSDKALTCQLN